MGPSPTPVGPPKCTGAIRDVVYLLRHICKLWEDVVLDPFPGWFLLDTFR